MSSPYLVLLSLILLAVLLQYISPTIEGFHPIYRRLNRNTRINISDEVNRRHSQAKRFIRQNFNM